MSSVAVIGLGAMGSRLARRLVDAGHDVVVWNRSPNKARNLVAAGAAGAETPAEAARRSQTVITMVADPSALAAVTEGQDGVAAGADDSTTVVNMSTVGPAAVERLAEVLPFGTALLDAPVLGSLPEADVGAGSAAKLVANFTLFGVLGIIGESLAATDALGLFRESAFDVLAATPVAAQAERRRPAIEAHE